MNTQNTQKGFTLIELMVVIVVVGVLSAVAIPSLFNMTAKAKMTEVVVNFGTFERFADTHYHIQGEYAKSLGEMGLELPQGNYFDLSELYEEHAEKPVAPKFGKAKAAKKENGNGQGKATICHNAGDKKTVTITVANPSVLAAHLKHGDSLGECEEPVEEDFTLSVIAVAKGNIGADCEAGSTLKSTYGANGYSITEVSGNCSVYLPMTFK